MSREIPVFFSTDDTYIPFLDVAVSSLIANASENNTYRIIVLNTGLDPENIATIKKNERPGFVIDFVDISKEIQQIRSYFKNVYHFSVVTYYRLFIASLFPQYDKIVYLDCDLVVLGDISKLYDTPMGSNILGAVADQFVRNTPQFREYARKAIGVDPDRYINAGVLLINLKAFRKNNIEEKFVKLITGYDFDLLDPDQAYLNFLCRDKILLLPNGWNKEPMPLPWEGDKRIIHYALYKKPWQYDDVLYGEYFWQYAEKSPFYTRILEVKAAFGPEDRAKKEAAATQILAHAKRILASDHTFCKKIIGGEHHGKIGA